MNRWVVAFFALVVLVALVFGRYVFNDRWDRDHGERAAVGTDAAARTAIEQSDSPRGETTEQRRTPSDEIEIPGAYRLTDIAVVPSAESLEDLLGYYPEEDRRIIEAFYLRYGTGMGGVSKYSTHGIFSFHSREQLAWLVRNGYPTPDEVLLAEQMSDAALQALSDQGNFKAMALYLQRLSRTLSADGGDASRVRRESVIESAELERRLLAVPSPFGGFALADRYARTNRHESAIAAYLYADLLGDVRATEFAGRHAALHQNADAVATAISYGQLLVDAARSNPTLANVAQLQQRPRFPRF